MLVRRRAAAAFTFGDTRTWIVENAVAGAQKTLFVAGTATSAHGADLPDSFIKARWGKDGGWGEGNPLARQLRGFPSPVLPCSSASGKIRKIPALARGESCPPRPAFDKTGAILSIPAGRGDRSGHPDNRCAARPG